MALGTTRKDETDFGMKFLDDIIDWIRDTLSPEDVFNSDQLEAWAEANGYVLEDK